MRYACNCKAWFQEPKERTVHMATCPVMNVQEIANRLARLEKAYAVLKDALYHVPGAPIYCVEALTKAEAILGGKDDA